MAMDNKTVRDAIQVHGTNPQFLIEKILRTRIYESTYWKESCFGLTESSIIEKAYELNSIGGQYGIQKPTEFICLVLKLLQLQPREEIVIKYITGLTENDSNKYLRALGAFYLRLVGKPVDIYKNLEPLLVDGRKLRKRGNSGYSIIHMDEFIDELLREERVCDVVLPRLTKRYVLEDTGELNPRISALEEVEMELEQEREAEVAAARDRDPSQPQARGQGPDQDPAVVRQDSPDNRTADVRDRCQRVEARAEAEVGAEVEAGAGAGVRAEAGAEADRQTVVRATVTAGAEHTLLELKNITPATPFTPATAKGPINPFLLHLPELVEPILSFLSDYHLRFAAGRICRQRGAIVTGFLDKEVDWTLARADVYKEDDSDWTNQPDTPERWRQLTRGKTWRVHSHDDKVKSSTEDPYYDFRPDSYKALIGTLKEIIGNPNAQHKRLGLHLARSLNLQKYLLPLLSIVGLSLERLVVDQMLHRPIGLEIVLALCPRLPQLSFAYPWPYMIMDSLI
ncbi:hypothetical protein EC957_012435 [Mortierella hygrophila]|uniref:Pre-mRNA-splicing factor 38 n=1 Tax=Mortierella hygrophila TaxID=979708 RepID=A0A9P6F861_9FUNG|nr:hypothetical protein EC957_012435 [Mortierella hygrophila]